MKKYYIFGLIFTAVLFVSIISPRLFTQSYRLTKVGYIDLQRVIKEVTSDQELADKLKEKQEEYKQQNIILKRNGKETGCKFFNEYS